jgi:hypothetical protein
VLFTINVLNTGAGYRVQGFYFNVLSNEQYHANDFDQVEITPAHLLIVLYSLLSVGVTVLAIVLCLRSSFRRKWLWILGFLVSFPTVCFNWTTTEISFELIRFTLLGFAFSRHPLFAPWTLCTTIPIVSITFVVLWFHRRQRQRPGGQLHSAQTGVAA